MAHRLFLATLRALYAALLALIGRRFGLSLPFALLAAALAMCARYSVYHYVLLVEGHHYVQGLLFEGALLALLAGLRGPIRAPAGPFGRAASSPARSSARTLLALVPALAVLGYVGLRPRTRPAPALAAGRVRRRRSSLGVASACSAYRARVAPQATLAPGLDVHEPCS